MEHTRIVLAIMADATPDSNDDENFYMVGGAIFKISWPKA